MTYELTDTNDALIKIGPTISGDQVFVQIRDIEISAGYIRNEDAPAVALAILEAAGIDDDSEMFAASAVRNLRRVAEIRAEKAERDAEDAKVRAFSAAINPGPGVIVGDYGVSDRAREQYRAARKFFEES